VRAWSDALVPAGGQKALQCCVNHGLQTTLQLCGKRMNEDQPEEEKPLQPVSEQVEHQAVTARVPENVGGGVFATGASILQASDAFVVDFLLAITSPVRVSARVVMSPGTFLQFVLAMEDNYGKFASRFLPPQPASDATPTSDATQAAAGSQRVEPPDTPSNLAAGSNVQSGEVAGAGNPEPPERKGTQASELYSQVKLPDEMLGGAYANSIMIRHDAHEFAIDFIANFYPRPVVTSRVFMAAGRVEILVRTVRNSWDTYQRNLQQPPPPPESVE